MYGREGSKFCGVVTTDSAPVIDFAVTVSRLAPVATPWLLYAYSRRSIVDEAVVYKDTTHGGWFCVLLCVPSKPAPDFLALRQLQKRLN
jgi:hypothetical protein